MSDCEFIYAILHFSSARVLRKGINSTRLCECLGVLSIRESVGFYDLHIQYRSHIYRTDTPFTAQRFIQSSLNFGNSGKDFSSSRARQILAEVLACARFRHFVEFTSGNYGDLKGFVFFLGGMLLIHQIRNENEFLDDQYSLRALRCEFEVQRGLIERFFFKNEQKS